MEKWWMVIASNCKDKNRETEFNEWYERVHVPDVLRGSPDFKKATRYQIMGSGHENQGKYLAIYEIETNDLKKTMEAHARNMENVRKAGRFSELFARVSRHICKVEDY